MDQESAPLTRHVLLALLWFVAGVLSLANGFLIGAALAGVLLALQIVGFVLRARDRSGQNRP